MPNASEFPSYISSITGSELSANNLQSAGAETLDERTQRRTSFLYDAYTSSFGTSISYQNSTSGSYTSLDWLKIKRFNRNNYNAGWRCKELSDEINEESEIQYKNMREWRTVDYKKLDKLSKAFDKEWKEYAKEAFTEYKIEFINGKYEAKERGELEDRGNIMVTWRTLAKRITEMLNLWFSQYVSTCWGKVDEGGADVKPKRS